MRSSIIRGVAAAVFALALCTVTAQETSLKTVQDFETLFNEHHEEMVLVRDIHFYSICEHHMVTILGKAHEAYIQ